MFPRIIRHVHVRLHTIETELLAYVVAHVAVTHAESVLPLAWIAGGYVVFLLVGPVGTHE